MTNHFFWFAALLVAVAPIGLLFGLRLMLRALIWQFSRYRTTITSLSDIERLSRVDHVFSPVAQALTQGTHNVRDFCVGRSVYSMSSNGLTDAHGAHVSARARRELSPLFTAAALAHTDPALQAFAAHGIDTSSLERSHQFVRKIGRGMVYRKGSVETAYLYGSAGVVYKQATEIWDHGHVRKLGARDRISFQAFIDDAVANGRHVGALAFRTGTAKDSPTILLGVVSLEDPLRTDTPAALHSLSTAGVALSLITSNKRVSQAAVAPHIAAQYLAPPAAEQAIRSAEQSGATTATPDTTLAHLVSSIRLARQSMRHIALAVRIGIVVMLAQVLLVLTGLAWHLLDHTAPIIGAWGLLAVELALILPLGTLAHDRTYQQLMRHPAKDVTRVFRDPRRWLGWLGFSCLAVALTATNYAFFFFRHTTNAQYLELSLPLWHQATTLSAITLIACLYSHIMFERTDHHERFFTAYIAHNKRLIIAFGVSLFAVSLPTFWDTTAQQFALAPLDVLDWISALFAACLYACGRLVQRQSRKHTRRAVLTLHRKMSI